MGNPVSGEVELEENQDSIAFLSYVCPSLATTGSIIKEHVMGHTYASGNTSSDEDEEAMLCA